MAVLSTATSSGRQIYQGSPSGTSAVSTGYTTPANNANVTNPSATFYVKEIKVINYSAAPVNAYVYAGGTANSNLIGVFPFTLSQLDEKVVSGINTMIPAGQTIYVQTSVANSCTFVISGVEIQ
jgi:hypothetical protein